MTADQSLSTGVNVDFHAAATASKIKTVSNATEHEHDLSHQVDP